MDDYTSFEGGGSGGEFILELPPNCSVEVSYWESLLTTVLQMTLRYHVQGFVATGSTTFPYAGSHSDDFRGSVFVIRRYAPEPRLAYIHGTAERDNETFDRHPSGVHALGHFVGANETNDLRIFSLDDPGGASIVYTEPPAVGMEDAVDMGPSGGGLGLARLGPHEYLVASTTPGGTERGHRSTHFWKIDGPITSGMHQLVYLGGGEHQIPWGVSYERSENLSLITECESGQIYAVHTTGDFDIYGDGFWRISRLEQGAGGPVFRALDVYVEGQNAHTCHLRAAASAYANDSGEIVTYCHEYDARKEAGEVSEGVDFTRRPPDYTDSCIQSCGGSSAGGMCWCDAACAYYGDCCNDVATHCPG